MVFSYTATTENGSLDSRIDPSDPMAREAQTFPIVSEEMAARIARYGSEERFESRAPVFSRGDRSVDFFVVVEGSIEIFDIDEHDQPQVFAVLRARQFASELDLFNDRQVLVSGRAGEASRIVRVKRADFRRLVSTESDIGEIVMRAFILRRVGRHELEDRELPRLSRARRSPDAPRCRRRSSARGWRCRARSSGSTATRRRIH